MQSRSSSRSACNWAESLTATEPPFEGQDKISPPAGPMTRILLVGGGAFAPRACEALAEAQVGHQGAVEVVLLARRERRLDLIARHANARVRDVHPTWSVRRESDADRAIAGADAVILLARVGGHAARIHDESFPREFGLVGDEGLGPGGLANAWRTVPFMRMLAARLRHGAPDALIVNMMAPLGITTRVLIDEGIQCFGLCELPLRTLSRLGPSQGAFRYVGLNHLGWFWDVEGCPGLHPSPHYDSVFCARGKPLPAGRGAQLQSLSGRLIDSFAVTSTAPRGLEAERPTPWFEVALAPCLAAMFGATPWNGFVNVPNDGLVEELPFGHLIELAARVDAKGPHPVRPGPLPGEVVDFLKAIAASESLALAAAMERDEGRLAEAVRALPLRIAESQVAKLVARIVEDVD